MKRSGWKCCLLGAALAPASFTLALIAAQPAQPTPVETQDFENIAAAAAAGWSGLRNTIDGNNFGFSIGTNFTGSATGNNEAGGTFARVAPLSYFADTNLGGAFTLDQSFSASGELEYRNVMNNNNIVGIGYFDATQSSGPGRSFNFMGIILAENNSVNPDVFRFFAAASIVGTSNEILSAPTVEFPVDGDYRWFFDYDGLTRTLSASILNNAMQLLANRNINLSGIIGPVNFNAFGLSNGELQGNGTNKADIYIDNVVYSVVSAPFVGIPEPSALALFALSLAGLLVLRRRPS